MGFGVRSAAGVRTAADGSVQQLTAGKLKAVNRRYARVWRSPGGTCRKRKDLASCGLQAAISREGTIELDVRGRDLSSRSFLGVAFHGKDDNTYEAVYLRPFNFRATIPPAISSGAIHGGAGFRLAAAAQGVPEEFENPVDPSVAPTDWVPLRVVVKGRPSRSLSAP